jgi:ceramide kinase
LIKDLSNKSLVDDGYSVYEKEISPLFQEVNIDVKTIFTERANHAYDYILEHSLDPYDGLLCIGGDGMFSELCHSLLLKTIQQSGLNINDPTIDLKRSNLRIGVIPSGSTGHNDPITSALQIITGQSLLIDIATVRIPF